MLQHRGTPFLAATSLQGCTVSQLQHVQTNQTGGLKPFQPWYKEPGSRDEQYSFSSKRSHDGQCFYWSTTLYTSCSASESLATRSLIMNIKHVDQERPFSHGEETKQKLTIFWASVCLAVLPPWDTSVRRCKVVQGHLGFRTKGLNEQGRLHNSPSRWLESS